MTADLKAAALQAIAALERTAHTTEAERLAAAAALRAGIEAPSPAEGDELPPLAVRMAAALREIAKPLAKGSKSILERAADMLEAQPTGTEPAPAPCECPDRGYCDGSCSPGNQPSDGLPNIVTSAPETIYLVIDPDLRPEADFREIMRSFEDSVQWCAEDSYDNGIKYVRADTLPDVQPKGTPAGYVTAIEEGKALMLPRPSLDTTGLVAVYTAAQAPAPVDEAGRAKLVADLMMMVGRYWDIAFVEGKEGRLHDTPAGDAQRVLSAIYEAAKHLAGLAPCAAVGADDVDLFSYHENEIANACVMAEIPDSKCESLLIALQEGRASKPPVQGSQS